MRLPEKIALFPQRPGVYLFKDAAQKVLYVGKAKNLRKRIKNYFAKSRDDRAQVGFLLRRAKDIDFIVTDTEKEALLLENTLIKKHRPRYNFSLRDDKSYISIRIGAGHEYPGIHLTRKIKKDGALYFGPYDSGLAAREAVENITKYFMVRSCSDTEFANRVRPCLKFDIGRCTAPCVGRVSKSDYAIQVEEAKMFLKGKSSELIRILRTKMDIASEDQRYEEAAKFRNAIMMLKELVERQNVVRHGGGDHDVIGIWRKGDLAAICTLKVRGGTLLGKRIFFAQGTLADDAKLIEEFLLQRYREGEDHPSLIALSIRPEAIGQIAQIVSESGKKKTKLIVPSRGDMKRLVELAVQNAREALAAKQLKRDDSMTLERIGQRLGLPQTPERIECIDISNTGGRDAVGSVVVFVGGLPDKGQYRTYNIRSLSTPDDYAMMQEVLSRRYASFDDAGRSLAAKMERPLPDLLLVDGGKGQLGIARRVLGGAGIPISIAAIAKGEKKGHADQIFIPGRMNPINLKRGSKELLLLMRIRDEAHRFGLAAHRKRRSKAAIAKPSKL